MFEIDCVINENPFSLQIFLGSIFGLGGWLPWLVGFKEQDAKVHHEKTN